MDKITEAIQRVTEMEGIYDQALKIMDNAENSPEEFLKNQAEFMKLADYYSSQDWKDDFALDEEGKLPQNLKRGVLSEDGVYNLIERNKELLEEYGSGKRGNDLEVADWLETDMKLIIASNNKGKILEYKDIFEPYGFIVSSQSEEDIHIEVEETGATFEENAVLKARAIYDIAHCCVISDDSGLEVEALGGEPGLYSARYKGLKTEHERRMAILKGLEGKDNRKARFVTSICFIDKDGKEHLFTGVWNGTIAFGEEGTSGFGYDPIFISEDGNGKTTASLPISFKETYSHRAKAVKKLITYLEAR